MRDIFFLLQFSKCLVSFWVCCAAILTSLQTSLTEAISQLMTRLTKSFRHFSSDGKLRWLSLHWPIRRGDLIVINELLNGGLNLDLKQRGQAKEVTFSKIFRVLADRDNHFGGESPPLSWPPICLVINLIRYGPPHTHPSRLRHHKPTFHPSITYLHYNFVVLNYNVNHKVLILRPITAHSCTIPSFFIIKPLVVVYLLYCSSLWALLALTRTVMIKYWQS